MCHAFPKRPVEKENASLWGEAGNKSAMKSALFALFLGLAEQVAHAVNGGVAPGVDHCGIHGCCRDAAVSQQLRDGVQVGARRQCHCGIAVAAGVERHVLADAGLLHPLLDGAAHVALDWQLEHPLVVLSALRQPPHGLAAQHNCDFRIKTFGRFTEKCYLCSKTDRS